jgi:hypothetical protein
MSSWQALDLFLVPPIRDDSVLKLFTGLLDLFLVNKGG